MPSGERSQTWFPELVTQLRSSWKAGLPWEAIIELRDTLQRRLEQILSSGGIKPAIVRCRYCGSVAPGAPPTISVRAMLLALSRFGIESDDVVRTVELAWGRHRKLNNLDVYGQTAQQQREAAHRHSGAPV